MSEYFISNSKQLRKWMGERMKMNRSMVAIKGPNPDGSDTQVNIAWKDEETGEVFPLTWEKL